MAGRTEAPWSILNAELTGHTPIIRAKANSFDIGKVNVNKPYIVEGVNLKSVKGHDTTIDVWVNGFGADQNVQAKGRSVWALKSADKLHKEWLAFSPPSAEEIEKGHMVYNSILLATSLFGYMGTMKNSS